MPKDNSEVAEKTKKSVSKSEEAVKTVKKTSKVKKKPVKEKKPTDKLADKTNLTKFLQGVFGDPQKRTLKRMYRKVQEINKLKDKYAKMSDEELASQTAIFKDDIEGGKKLDDILVPAFAVMREASTRVLHMTPFDVQMIGAIALHEGNVAEMKTGEGKTLVAVAPAYLNALSGHGVHIVTVNDYLAQRDAGWNGPLYNFLGISVGVIINNASFVYDPEYNNEEHDDPRMRHLRPATRKEAYQADVTYGTNNEFGFDYLRDNMASEVKFLRQRELNFAIVDEVDSILIDEARTPLIISAPSGDNPEAYYQFARVASRLNTDDFVVDEKHRSVTLTDKGVDKVQEILGIDNLYSVKNTRLVYHMDQALRAETLFKRDRDYVVTNSGEVIIVDQNTGRLMQGRRYNEGLHQAIEAKEGVAVKQESMTLATISFQNYFRLYNKLSGMTGTAFTEAEEFQQIYQLDVIQIPPNKPIARIDKDDVIYRTEAGKIRAIIKAVKHYHHRGQPVLIGTASIVKNELIAKALDEEGLPYEILNAKNNEREAAVIAKAGEIGAITLATNMAGRGTDIRLAKGVRELGGLVVIGSERHDSRRVDNQLRGRGGRQGDPGITQFFVSCEDDLMRIFQGERIGHLMARLGADEDTPIQLKTVSRTLEEAQKRIEGFNFDSRKNVVQYDNVINRHRRVVYMIRRKILEGEDIHAEIDKLIKDEAEALTIESARINKHFAENFESIYHFDEDVVETIGHLRKPKDRAKLAYETITEAYKKQEEKFGSDDMRRVEREIYLKVLDVLWMQHLENMQHLREGIHWRSVGQRDPLVEYRGESQNLFSNLQRNLREEFLRIALTITPQEAASQGVIDGQEYDSELTKMAESATEKGVNEISKGDRNLDSEFRKDGSGSKTVGAAKRASKNSVSPNEQRNKARKKKKQQRQNKKHGKRR